VAETGLRQGRIAVANKRRKLGELGERVRRDERGELALRGQASKRNELGEPGRQACIKKAVEQRSRVELSEAVFQLIVIHILDSVQPEGDDQRLKMAYLLDLLSVATLALGIHLTGNEVELLTEVFREVNIRSLIQVFSALRLLLFFLFCWLFRFFFF
jgi:hypothetical protein